MRMPQDCGNIVLGTCLGFYRTRNTNRGNKGLILIAAVANSKCYQHLNKILLFLPTLHLGNQKSCLQENAIRRRNVT